MRLCLLNCCWLFIFSALLCANTARAQSLSAEQWTTIYTDLGSAAFLPFSGVHYGSDWELAAIAAEYRLMDLRLPGQTGHAWRTYTGGAPQSLSTVGVVGWFKLFKRLQIGGGFRHEPVANLAVSSLNFSAQLLKGTANRAAFFLGTGLSYLRNPNFNYFAPNVFVELSNELYRTAADTRGPWIFYMNLRLDQGFRIVNNLDPAITNNDGFMPAYVRGGFRIRRRDLQWGYDFGGQQKRVFTHSFLISYVLPGKEQRENE